MIQQVQFTFNLTLENPLFTGVPKGQAAPFGSEGLSFHNFVKKSPSRKPPTQRVNLDQLSFTPFLFFATLINAHSGALQRSGHQRKLTVPCASSMRKGVKKENKKGVFKPPCGAKSSFRERAYPRGEQNTVATLLTQPFSKVEWNI
jgi:hypothetical protein